MINVTLATADLSYNK